MGMKILQEERDIYYSAPEQIAWARADESNALGRRLMEMLADLPEGKDARVSYMEVRNHTWEENPLAWHYKMQLAVQDIPGRPEVEAEPGAIKGNDVAGRLYRKEPWGEGFSGAVKLVLGEVVKGMPGGEKEANDDEDKKQSALDK